MQWFLESLVFGAVVLVIGRWLGIL